ncbi:hypothetical protein ACQEU3_46955 [Spirillospora sp. CA-253888]
MEMYRLTEEQRPARCPTPCRPDCDRPCHEDHRPVWERRHHPGTCPGHSSQETP